MANFNLLIILKTALQTPEFINKVNTHFNINLKLMEKREIVWETIKNFLEQTNPTIPNDWTTISLNRAQTILDGGFSRNTIKDKVEKGFIRTASNGQVYLEDIRLLKVLTTLSKNSAMGIATKKTKINGKSVIALIPTDLSNLKNPPVTQDIFAFAVTILDPNIQKWAKELANHPYAKNLMLDKDLEME
jgi:hypothetical protein